MLGKRFKVSRGAAFGLSMLAASSLAQQAPDAGRLLQEQPRPQAPALTPPAPASRESPAPDAAAPGPTIAVSAFRFRGNTLIPASELRARVAALEGRQVALAELRRAAEDLTAYYTERGFAALVTIPPQQVVDGVVEFLVTEGRRGQVRVETQGPGIDPARIARFVDARMAGGGPVDLDALSQVTAILDELPGLDATSSIGRGGGQQEVDLRIVAKAQAPTTFFAGTENSGSRASGVWQARAGVTLANPIVGLDQLSAITNVSEGTRYLRGAYDVALGDRGLVVGVNAAALTYRLLGPAFAALQARGEARTLGITAAYPLVRRDGFGLSVLGGAEWRWMEDSTVAGQTGDRAVQAATLGVQGYSAVPVLPNALLSWQFDVSAGEVDQRNAAARAADAAGRATQGSFTKAAWRLDLERPLDGGWLFSARARGQWAGGNLDSSEQFSLGGQDGVRAYPGGEATGDEGVLVSLEFQRTIADTWRVAAFFDAGRVKLHDRVPAAGIATPNTYLLQGAGVRIQWQPFPRSLLGLTLAAPVGSNPGRDAAGNNADGRPSNAPRAWLNFVAQF